MSTTKQPNHLRVVMAEQNTTNRWLATELGVAEMTISRWSTNIKSTLSVAQLSNIAKILDVTLDDLVEPYRDPIEINNICDIYLFVGFNIKNEVDRHKQSESAQKRYALSYCKIENLTLKRRFAHSKTI